MKNMIRYYKSCETPVSVSILETIFVDRIDKIGKIFNQKVNKDIFFNERMSYNLKV